MWIVAVVCRLKLIEVRCVGYPSKTGFDFKVVVAVSNFNVGYSYIFEVA